MDYFLARYYSSAQGRFTSVDPSAGSGRPIRPQSWNRYAYVLNNPLRLIDPNGLMDGDPNKPKVVVVVFQGGNLSDSTHTEIVRVKAGGSTEGLGESKIDVEGPHIAQQIKNAFPDADVVLAGPHTTSQLTNELTTNKPDHIIIEGFSAGGVAAIGLTNNLTGNGQSVDQLITVDPRNGPLTTGSNAGIKNPGSVGEAVNYTAPGFKDAVVFGPAMDVKGAQNEVITAKPGVKVRHENADDITSPKVIERIENKLSEIYKKPN